MWWAGPGGQPAGGSDALTRDDHVLLAVTTLNIAAVAAYDKGERDRYLVRAHLDESEGKVFRALAPVADGCVTIVSQQPHGMSDHDG